MDHPASLDLLSKELAATEAALARLETRNAELRAALEQVEHDSRRCNDALERAGWRSGQAEARGSMLAESRRMIVADLERNRALCAKLTRRLGRIQNQLKQK